MAMTFNRSLSGQAAQPIAIGAGYWLLVGSLVLTGSYSTGGDTLDLTPFFPAGKTIREAVVLSSVRGFDGEYDVVNKKMLLYGIDPAAASIQVAAAQHAAAAYDADLTPAGGIPIAILLKG